VKVVHHKAEDGRVAVRNVRRAIRKDLEALEKDGDISSDELERAEKDLDRGCARAEPAAADDRRNGRRPSHASALVAGR